MIDDQKLVYEKALEMGRKSYRDSKKRVLIISTSDKDCVILKLSLVFCSEHFSKFIF